MEECPAYCFFLITDTTTSDLLSKEQRLLSTHEIKVPLLTQSDRYKVLTMDIGNEADSKDLWEITCQTQVMLLVFHIN